MTLAPLIGELIVKAFFDDAAFRAKIRSVNELLRIAVDRCGDEAVEFSLETAFNSYMVSSFHAAQAIELIQENIIEIYKRESRTDSGLKQLQHSLCLEAVINL